jgi:UDP-MurNAc hydroxylase
MITFINHASFMVTNNGVSLLCDPWISGPAFHNGWNLIVEEDHPGIRDIQYIWYSHEHPDHFSISFLKSIPEDKRSAITVLYQHTNDGRVLAFCKKLGFGVQELAHGVPVQLKGDLRITCGTVPFYDSWSFIETPQYSILNSNDCILENPERLSLIQKHVKKCDILFTQFSYANWQDSQDNRQARRDLALDKLSRIKIQCAAFSPKFVVPFASFVYFSHVENGYMNADVNTPAEAIRYIKEECNATPVLLQPNEQWDGLSPKSNAAASLYWTGKYVEAVLREKHQPLQSFDLATLIGKAAAMVARVKTKNNLGLLKMMQLIGILKPVYFDITDQGAKAAFDWRGGFYAVDHLPSDSIKIHSESLAFIFDNDFGVDTVNVNARFDAPMLGKKRLIRLFAVLALNNTGRFITWRDAPKYLNWSFLHQGLRTAGLLGK